MFISPFPHICLHFLPAFMQQKCKHTHNLLFVFVFVTVQQLLQNNSASLCPATKSMMIAASLCQDCISPSGILGTFSLKLFLRTDTIRIFENVSLKD